MENATMSQEVHYLVLTSLLTAVMWVPYILNRLIENGILGAMKIVPSGPATEVEWAKRGTAAHKNAVENLVVFAALILSVQVSGAGSELTATAAMIYFWARVVHYVVYVIGIYPLRTLSFAVGAFCQIAIALHLLGWI